MANGHADILCSGKSSFAVAPIFNAPRPGLALEIDLGLYPDPRPYVLLLPHFIDTDP
jgi:hypothetical protein